MHEPHEENQFCRPKLDAGLCAVSICESSPEWLTDLFSDSGTDPCCLTSLLYTPRIRIVGAHCPTKSASWCLSSIFKISEAAIEAPAAHKNASEGSLAVCFLRSPVLQGLRYVHWNLSLTILRSRISIGFTLAVFRILVRWARHQEFLEGRIFPYRKPPMRRK